MNTKPQLTLRAKRHRALKNQITRLTARLETLYRLSGRYAQLRLAIFVAGLLLSGAAFFLVGGWALAGVILGIFLVGFGAAVYAHRRVEQSIIKHQIWRQLKSAQIARMDLDWDNIPAATTGRARAGHPFARDLDLTGARSLLRLIDTCVSEEGSERLRDWLLNTAPDLAHIRRQQALVRTLVPLSHFRHTLTLKGMLAAAGAGGWWRGKRLLEWLNEGNDPKSLRVVLILSSLLVPLNLVLFGLYLQGQIPAYWVPPFIAYVGLLFLKWQETAALFHNALTLQNGLKKLEGVFQHLEAFPLERYSPLKELCRPFLDSSRRPSDKLKQVARLVTAAGLTQNPAIALLLNALLPWNLYFAHRLNQYKAEAAHHFPRWLDIWFELEALSSLAGFAYLNPDYAFPEIRASSSEDTAEKEPLFQARALGHPLIPRSEKVCNDFTIGGPGEVDIITGSNMAGKSSFLRTLGVNLRLAYVGGPVGATACQMTLFRLFSSINVSDSVTDGISYFYAEVKRLKALLSELEREDPLPLCYLIDEIFRGTNNRERYLGSQAYVRALAGQHGFGLIATHDLELVKLAGDIPHIKNYHFREEVVDGRMAFDYRLRPGPCPTTNALKIMRLEGLPVEDG